MEIKIIELSENYLDEALKIIHKSFSSFEEYENPNLWLPASLNPKKYEWLYKKYGDLKVKFYLAIYENKIIGIVGYYTNKSDYLESDWLAWFAVDPLYRRKGVGKQLLEFIINNSKKRKKQFLRVYTSDEAEKKEAQLLYEKEGFKLIKKELSPNKDYMIFFKELNLID